MQDIVEIFNSEIKDIHSTNRDMKNYIDSFHKESERCAAYLKQSTIHFENVSNITINSDSVIQNINKTGVIKIARRLITTKMSQK